MGRTRAGGVTAVITITATLVACGSDSTGSATTPSLPTIETAASTSTTSTVAATTTTLAQYYEIQAGDSLSGIAQKFNVRFDDLVAINEITNPDHIQVGDTLLIPPPTVLLNDVATTVGAVVPGATATTVAP
jgi:LysM repeat protein